MKHSKELIDHTLNHFQPYYEETLTEEDAIEIIDNFTGFMTLLIKCDRAKKEREANNG